MHTLFRIACTLFFRWSPYIHYICITMIQPRFVPSFRLCVRKYSMKRASSQFLPQIYAVLHFMRISVRLMLFVLLLLPLSIRPSKWTQYIIFLLYLYGLVSVCVCVYVKLWNTPTNLSANNVVIFINPVKVTLVQLTHIYISKCVRNTLQFTAFVQCSFRSRKYRLTIEWRSGKDVFDLYYVKYCLVLALQIIKKCATFYDFS